MTPPEDVIPNGEASDVMKRLGLFEGYGVELEYMIVDRQTLDVKPICDEVMKAMVGEYTTDVEPDGPEGLIGYSNELAMHVFELKTQRPVKTLDKLAEKFQEHVGRVNAALEAFGAVLMPTAMHPWMDPHKEMRLWPHDNSPIYEAFNRIFDCRGHGWANLQSVHLNLPFDGDEEFGKLHAAIRLVLPLLPGLAASSPVMDGKVTGLADNRLRVYQSNAKRVLLVSARVIPEPVYTEADYDAGIFQPMFEQIAPLDPEGILQHEWLNARGAIARFDRGSIEVRVLDVQECPAMDLAIVHLTAELIRALVEERWSSTRDQMALGTEALVKVLEQTIALGERALVDDYDLLDALGIAERSIVLADLWSTLSMRLVPSASEHRPALDHLTHQGTLSTRIVEAMGGELSLDRLRTVYARLARCLSDGVRFEV